MGIALVIRLTLFTVICVTIAKSYKSDRDFLSARCHAKCLADYTLRNAGVGFGLIDSDDRKIKVLRSCLEEYTCQACMVPCGEKFASISRCKMLCKNNSFACLESCQFTKLSLTYKPGICPSPSQATGFAAACVNSCKKDIDCDGDGKCCNNGCGYTCQVPVQKNEGLLLTPTNVKATNTRRGNVEISWEHNAGNDTVVYIVHSRSMRRKNQKGKTKWEKMAQTVAKSVVSSHINPGLWYEFKVAAVNLKGSRGFSAPSQSFKSKKAINRPSAPTNLTEGVSKLRNGLVDVSIYWQPPKFSEYPVIRYKIFWSQRLRSVRAKLVSLQEYSESVDGSQLSFTFKQLLPATSYFLQVQAVVKSGSVRARSSRASIFISTFSLDAADENEATTRRPSPDVGPIEGLQIGEVFYQKGHLKVPIWWRTPSGLNSNSVYKYTIHWQLELCQGQDSISNGAKHNKAATTHKTNFTLYSLHFDCHYSVRIAAVSSEGAVVADSLEYFYTPMCSDVMVFGKKGPICDQVQEALQLPSLPSNVTYSILTMSNHNSSVQISWTLPHKSSITEVHLVWGESLQVYNKEQRRKLVINRNTASRMVLHKSSKTAVINGLKANKTYLARIQLVSAAGLSHPVHIMFTTAIPDVHTSEMSSSVKLPQQSLSGSSDKQTLHHSLFILSLVLVFLHKL